MSTVTVRPLRQRMIKDMNARKTRRTLSKKSRCTMANDV